MIKCFLHALLLICVALVGFPPLCVASEVELELGTFGDRPLAQPLEHPDWFTVSFLDLREDLDAAVGKGKRGLILYFGQNDCPYCKAHLENNWGRKDIVTYTQKHFDVVHIDVRGDRTVTGFDGVETTEKEFAFRNTVQFTPSLLFYDANGRLALKIAGYRPPYQFRAALEYVADKHYARENFRNYLARAEPASSYGGEELNESDIFSSPPFMFDRRYFKSKQPLVVFFEEQTCHPCDVLHGGPLISETVFNKFQQFEAVQLDMWSETPVQLPGGEKSTAKHWADRLGINYAPTLIFFDETGQEIMRVDSVVGFYRLNGVLDFVLSKAYRTYPTYLKWRYSQGSELKH